MDQIKQIQEIIETTRYEKMRRKPGKAWRAEER
jgi:hypothetical protein